VLKLSKSGPVTVTAGGFVESLERRLCLSASFTAAPGSPITVGTDPHIVAVGDFNGDGIPDLAVTNANDNTISILLGNGSGGFTPASGSPITVGNGPLSVAAGDFTGNGKLDLAVANFTNDNVTVLLGNGNGTFTPAPGSPITDGSITGGEPSSIVVGDFNGDGNLDLAVANYDDNSVSVLLGKGNGTFAPAPGSPITVGSKPYALATGDFTANGKTDLAVANFGDGTVSVLLGVGNGSFNAAPGSPITVGSQPTSVAVGDFSGDGTPDLAVANSSSNTVSVLLGTGNGAFTAASGSPITVGADPSSVVAADLNGDGETDLAVTNFDGNSFSLLLGNGDGTFTAAADSPIAVGNGPDAVAEADLNGDGDPDLVVSNSADNTVSVLLNAAPASGTVPLPTGTLGVTVSASLPSSIVGGVKLKGNATVTVSAPAGKPINGPVTVTLYVSSAKSLTNATKLLAVTQKLKLKAGAHKALRLKLSSFASALQGSYFLIAAAKGPDRTTTAVAGPSLTIAKPFVSILVSRLNGSPAAVAPHKDVTLSLTLQNTGNIPAAANPPLTVSLSTSSSGTAAQTVATTSLRGVKLKAGQSKAYRVKFVVPAGTTAGSYYLASSLSVSALGDPTAADGIAVSGMPVIVS
jgi:hypothetical protein